MRKALNFDRIVKTLILGLILSCTGCSQAEWQQLFNGKDLDDWQIKIRTHELNENYANTFQVKDGMIQVRYDEYEDGFKEQYGHLFYKKPFSYYLIGVEYRFVGEQVEGGAGWAYRNSGVMIHGQDPATMKLDQDFPNSIEVQLLGGDGSGERSTANLCTPGTQYVRNGEVVKTHCVNSSSDTFDGDQWVRVEILVLGDSLIKHFVNGEQVLQYKNPQTDAGELIAKGSISLQSESHPVDFRKVEIVNLEEYKNDPEKLKKVVERLLAEDRMTKE